MVSSTILATAAAVGTERVDNSDTPLIVHAGTSTTYRIGNAEFYGCIQRFVKRHLPPYSLLPFGNYPEPSSKDVLYDKQRKIAMAITGVKVRMLCAALSLCGKADAARKLEVCKLRLRNDETCT